MVTTTTLSSKGATMILHGLLVVALVASSVMARFLDANDLQVSSNECHSNLLLSLGLEVNPFSASRFHILANYTYIIWPHSK